MKWGGGGGGAAGRVRINTASGVLTADPKFVVSPSVAPALQQGNDRDALTRACFRM